MDPDQTAQQSDQSSYCLQYKNKSRWEEKTTKVVDKIDWFDSLGLIL